MVRLLLLTVLIGSAWAASAHAGEYYILGLNQRISDWTLRPGQVWVVYGADWCGPCKVLDKNLGLLLKEAKITVIYVDADLHRSICTDSKFDVGIVIILY